MKVRVPPVLSGQARRGHPPHGKKSRVLDRTREPGSQGEPLYMDVVTALAGEGRGNIAVCGGRYGLGSKDAPADIFAVFEELQKARPKRRFTVGINDDVTPPVAADTPGAGHRAAGRKYPLNSGVWAETAPWAPTRTPSGSSATTPTKYVQAYFQYDSKKTGGVTMENHLRFGDRPIKNPYYVTKADFAACHNQAITLGYPMAGDVKPGGAFLVNCQWSDEELGAHLSGGEKRHIARSGVRLYSIDAVDIARQMGMGKRTNTVLRSFFAISGVMPLDAAVGYMKEAAAKSYMSKTQDVVDMNCRAIEAGALRPSSGRGAARMGRRAGRARPVSALRETGDIENGGDTAPGEYAAGRWRCPSPPSWSTRTAPSSWASQYEKRGVAVTVPSWDRDKCLEVQHQLRFPARTRLCVPSCLRRRRPPRPRRGKAGARQDRQGQGNLQIHHGRIAAGLPGLRRRCVGQCPPTRWR